MKNNLPIKLDNKVINIAAVSHPSFPNTGLPIYHLTIKGEELLNNP